MGQKVTDELAGAELSAPAKICPSCQTLKCLPEFYNDASKRDGLSSSCKICINERAKARLRANPEPYKMGQAKWRKKNRQYLNQKNREWRLANPELAKEHQRRYKEKNPDLVKASKKKWEDANPEYMAEKARNTARRRLKTPKGKLEAAIRSSLVYALKGNKGGRRTFELLGYTALDLMKHLESLFESGMNLANYGRNGWEVDHKRPLASFNYSDADDEQFRLAWGLDNLQPLWMSENRKKGARLLPEHT